MAWFSIALGYASKNSHFKFTKENFDIRLYYINIIYYIKENIISGLYFIYCYSTNKWCTIIL